MNIILWLPSGKNSLNVTCLLWCVADRVCGCPAVLLTWRALVSGPYLVLEHLGGCAMAISL